MHKAMMEHEKCEITIQGMKKRMIEFKLKIQQLEQKEKWSWKNLVHKRHAIEGEKV